MGFVHPILTEAVTKRGGTRRSAGSFRYSRWLLSYTRAPLSPQDGNRVADPRATVAAALAVFSKESGIVLVAVMLIYDVTFARRTSLPWRAAGGSAVARRHFRHAGAALAQVSSLLISFGDNLLQGLPTSWRRALPRSRCLLNISA